MSCCVFNCREISLWNIKTICLLFFCRGSFYAETVSLLNKCLLLIYVFTSLLHQYSRPVWGIFTQVLSPLQVFVLSALKSCSKGHKNIVNALHCVVGGSGQINTVTAEVKERDSCLHTHVDLSSDGMPFNVKFEHFFTALATSIPSFCLRHPLITP